MLLFLTLFTVQKGFLHTSLDQLPTTQGIHLFLLGLVVSAEIIPRDYLYPVKESLSELPSEPSEILSLLTIPGSRCHLGISNSSLYYLQVFSIGLIALGCQFDVWAFPPTNVEGALYQFVSQNEGASSLPIQLHLHLASIFARLDSAIQPSAHQRVKRDKWLTSSILQTTPSVAPPSHVVNWLWNQQPLREWNQRCLVFWLFEVSALLFFFLYFILSFFHFPLVLVSPRRFILGRTPRGEPTRELTNFSRGLEDPSSLLSRGQDPLCS